jgi:hypothetical protein
MLVMKNKILIIIMSCIAITACNDEFLEKYPLSAVSDAAFFRTANDIQMYANQFYVNLDPQNYSFQIDNNSDNQGAGDRPAYLWNEYTLPASGGGWAKSDWLPIRRCNYALARIAKMPNPEDAVVKKNEAEIRFFRAYLYMKKIQQFGDVPWFDRDLNIDSPELQAPRESRKVVFANMMEDLDFAAANLPDASAGGRLTKYAALFFKAEACLYEGTFRKYHNLGDHEVILRASATSAEGVINSGKFDVYNTGKTMSDYFDMFVQYDLSTNKEMIMFQKFAEGLVMHNDVRQLGEQHTGYTKDFVNSYLCTDGLPIALSPLYQGDAVFGTEFQNRDPRMWQSTYNTDRVYRIYSDGTKEYRAMPEFDKNYCMTSYYILKGYSPYEIDRLQLQCVIDRPIFRYGRLLVAYAEAKAELGECTQAVLDASINKLRARVNMPPMTVNIGFTDPNWPNWEVPVTPLINEIRRERRIETCSEGLRWYDLQRWKAGKLIENPLTYQGARDPKTGQYRILYPGFTRKWDNKLYLYPIPTQELTLNPSLTQNPGW